MPRLTPGSFPNELEWASRYGTLSIPNSPYPDMFGPSSGPRHDAMPSIQAVSGSTPPAAPEAPPSQLQSRPAPPPSSSSYTTGSSPPRSAPQPGDVNYPQILRRPVPSSSAAATAAAYQTHGVHLHANGSDTSLSRGSAATSSPALSAAALHRGGSSSGAFGQGVPLAATAAARVPSEPSSGEDEGVPLARGASHDSASGSAKSGEKKKKKRRSYRLKRRE